MKTAGLFPSSPLWYDSTLHFDLSPVGSYWAAGVKESQDRSTSLHLSCVTGYDRELSCNKHAYREVMAPKPGDSSSTIIASGYRKQNFLPFFPNLPS